MFIKRQNGKELKTKVVKRIRTEARAGSPTSWPPTQFTRPQEKNMTPSSTNSTLASSKPYGRKPADLAPGELDRLEAVPKFEKITLQELHRVARELRKARVEDALRAKEKRQPSPPSRPTTIQ